jgi:hypothetical protein
MLVTETPKRTPSFGGRGVAIIRRILNLQFQGRSNRQAVAQVAAEEKLGCSIVRQIWLIRSAFLGSTEL